jgi:hypothetical protein
MKLYFYNVIKRQWQMGLLLQNNEIRLPTHKNFIFFGGLLYVPSKAFNLKLKVFTEKVESPIC